MGQTFGLDRAAASHRDVLTDLDGAIVLTPHHLHHPIALDCLAAGVPILVEKPLAETADQGRELVVAAEEHGAFVAVNNTRRLIPASRTIRDLLAAGEIGVLKKIEFTEGDRFDWPSATGAMFGASGSGRGVLTDIGAHVLDLASWWAPGPLELVSYADDARGGSEAVAKAEFRSGSCRVSVHLSWLSKLRNTYVIRGEEGTLEAGIYDWNSVTVRARGGSRRIVKAREPVASYEALAEPLLANFLAALEGREAPLVTGHDVLPSLELIDRCYARRVPLELPWEETVDRILPAHA